MKINTAKAVQNLDGTPIEGAPTIKEVIIQSLTVNLEIDKRAEPIERFRAGLLAQKIALSGAEVELTAEEIAKIKDRVGRSFAPLVVVQVWQHLEGTSPV